MKAILFVRHGRTQWNDDRRVQGRTDLRLTTIGRRQITALVPLVRAWKPQAIYSSPLARAVESAAILARAVSLQVISVPELTEFDVGEWVGKTGKELLESASWRAYQRHPEKAVPPGGESVISLRDRVVRSVDEVLRTRRRRVVIVTHGDVIRIAICHYLGLSLNRLHAMKIGLGSISVIEWQKGMTRLLALNCPLCFPDGLDSL